MEFSTAFPVVYITLIKPHKSDVRFIFLLCLFYYLTACLHNTHLAQVEQDSLSQIKAAMEAKMPTIAISTTDLDSTSLT